MKLLESFTCQLCLLFKIHVLQHCYIPENSVKCITCGTMQLLQETSPSLQVHSENKLRFPDCRTRMRLRCIIINSREWCRREERGVNRRQKRVRRRTTRPCPTPPPPNLEPYNVCLKQIFNRVILPGMVTILALRTSGRRTMCQ